MKKFIVFLFVAVLFSGCEGEMGDVGPMGDMGPAGRDGQVGPKGETGEKGSRGPKGQTGPKGDDGTTGAVTTYYTDWEDMPLSSWIENSDDDPYKFEFNKSKTPLSFIPGSEQLYIGKGTRNVNGHHLTDLKTGEPQGFLYIFNSIEWESEQQVFNLDLYNPHFNINDYSQGSSTATYGESSNTPTIHRYIWVSLSKEFYNGNETVDSFIKPLKFKYRMIYVPVDLGPSRLKSMDYHEVLEAFNIPENGSGSVIL